MVAWATGSSFSTADSYSDNGLLSPGSFNVSLELKHPLSDQLSEHRDSIFVTHS